jgi:retron-type reverse transcriptase
MPRILDMDNLRLAFWKASRGKRYSASVRDYQANLQQNLLNLRDQIESGCIEVGNYRYFKVFEPKERQICASAFSEQVLHHALMNVCHERFEQAQVFDSYASRKGKGVYAALDRAKQPTRDLDWFLKLDVRKFFESLHHNVIKQQLARLFKEPHLLHLLYQIIDSYEAHPQRGVPIGNLTSQYFANHYLSGLDHFVKEELGIAHYVRYMDDMVLWHADKAALKSAQQAIEVYVGERLHCQLKPALLNKTQFGVPFLGYRVMPYNIRLLHKSKMRFARKITRIDTQYNTGEWTITASQLHALPLIAFTQHSEALVFRKDVLLRVEGLSA